MARKKKVKADELGELDSAYARMVGKQPAAKKRSSAPLIVFLCVLLAVILGGGVWLLFGDHWLVMKDVTVAGVSLEGMSKKDAKALLCEMAETKYATESMFVTVLDTTLELRAQDALIELDSNGAINAAYGCTGVFDLTPYIRFTGEGLEQIITQLGQQFNAGLVPTTEVVEGTVPALDTPEDAQGQTLVVTIGTPEMGLDIQALREAILKGYSEGSFAVTAVCSVIPPEIPTADGLYEKYLTAPVNAVMDEATFAITPETYGYSIDAQQAAQLLSSAQYGDTVRIPFAKVSPEVTEASLLAELYKDILGECTTAYSGADSNNRNTNLGLACEKINGMVLMPGEAFSYNDTLGERTKENGWKPAASYVGGATVDTYGGGICQGSTTLYNCVLQADLKITMVAPHGYAVGYVPPGMDAMVNWGTSDFRFVNSTSRPIRLEAYRKDGQMTMRIYGTDEKDYYIKMSHQILGTTPYETIYKMVDPENNPENYKDGQVLVDPYSSYHVVTYKSKYDKETDALIETKKEREFTYNRRDQVVVKFITKDKDEAPKEP